MRLKLKFTQPKLRLHDLLRKRKTTFAAWLAETQVSSYHDLVRWCSLIGVAPPTEQEWGMLRPTKNSSPADGIVVLDPPPEAPKRLRKQRKEESVFTPVE